MLQEEQQRHMIDSCLVFAGDVTGEIRVIMKLTNKSRSRQAFKVKCSRNDLFRIRPSTGILDYGKSVYINITYNGDLQLVFTGDVLGEIRTTIKLTNRSDSRQAFKVKCTRNDLFRIRPAIGILDYKQTVLVTVIYRCQNNQAPESDRHHFGIYHIPAPEGCTGSGAWAEHYGPPQGELRLKVFFEDTHSFLREQQNNETKDEELKETSKSSNTE
ncbi:Uncharacterized protein Tcan_04710 [Toxocara canis]|uniref:Major sperm protein n=1 Tax=Toxocara canis TaxID=6265 RepID=A0A0B2V7Q7_TOXCA|nr:Uncharacterized protein Tcan_04710 [Toxocara canis]